MDVVVTVPLAFGLDTWIAEGDPAGTPWSREEWDFYLAGPRPDIKPGERVYVVYNGAIRGYAPLIRIETESYFVRRRGRGAFSLVRGGGAVALTIPEEARGFRGWRYRWWDRGAEVPFPNWQDPTACIGFERTPPAPRRRSTTASTSTPTPTTATRADLLAPPARQAPGQTWVVHCRKDPYDVYIGRAMPRFPELRATGWGNPFYAKNDTGSAIAQYRQWVKKRPALMARLRELKGKRLGCWCAPRGGLPGYLNGTVCHGQVLAALADELEPRFARTVEALGTPARPEDPKPAPPVVATRCGTFPAHKHEWVPAGFGGSYMRCAVPGCTAVGKAEIVQAGGTEGMRS